MRNSGSEKKSPIHEKPLRRPGQSLVEILSDIQLGQMILYVLIIGISGSFLIFIWFSFIFPSSTQPPYGISVVLVGAFAFSLYKLNRFKQEIDNLRLGIDGELAVAEYLDELKADGAIVFHDLIGNGFNIDHVLLSRKGIYVVETKTWRKRSSDKLIYDGVHLKLGENNLPNDAIKQVASEAHL